MRNVRALGPACNGLPLWMPNQGRALCVLRRVTATMQVSFAAVTAELQQLPAGGSGGGGGGGGGALPLPLPVPGMYGAVAGAGMVPGMPGSGVQPVKQEPQGSSRCEERRGGAWRGEVLNRGRALCPQ